MSNAVPVDCGNADEDGAIRLVTRRTVEYCEKQGLVLCEGMRIRISDEEITADGFVSKRGGIWVVVVEKWTEQRVQLEFEAEVPWVLNEDAPV